MVPVDIEVVVVIEAGDIATEITVASGGRATIRGTEEITTPDPIVIMNSNHLTVAGTTDQTCKAPQLAEIGGLKGGKMVKAVLRWARLELHQFSIRTKHLTQQFQRQLRRQLRLR